MLCIFCQQRTLDDLTKPEHILLNGLGGRMTTQIADCSSCNERFGGSIDSKLMRQVELIRNMLQLKSGSGRAAPARRNVQSGNDIIHIHGNGRVELGGKPFKVEHHADGTYTLEIRANSFEDAERLVPNIAAALKIPEAQLREQLGGVSGRIVERRPDVVHSQEGFGGPEAIRSMVKSAMVLWATEIGNEELHRNVYDEARAFVYEGCGTFNIERTSLDARVLPCADQLKEAYGQFFNQIYVRSNDDGRVIGHFTLYNCVAWQFLIAESGAEPNCSAAIVNNPLDPKTWISRGAAARFDLPFSWLSHPDFENGLVTMQDRLRAVMAFHVERVRDAEIERIVRDSASKVGLSYEEGVDADRLKELTSLIAHRSALFLLGRLYEEEVPLAKMKEVFRKKSAGDT